MTIGEWIEATTTTRQETNVLYQRGSFTVPTTGGKSVFECEKVGHMDPDAKGNCMRCGQPVAAKVQTAEAKKEYVELLDGPFNDEIVDASEIVPIGRSNYIERDGVRHELAVDGMYRGMVQMRYVGVLDPNAAPAIGPTTDQPFFKSVPEDAIIPNTGIERGMGAILADDDGYEPSPDAI